MTEWLVALLQWHFISISCFTRAYLCLFIGEDEQLEEEVELIVKEIERLSRGANVRRWEYKYVVACTILSIFLLFFCGFYLSYVIIKIASSYSRFVHNGIVTLYFWIILLCAWWFPGIFSLSLSLSLLFFCNWQMFIIWSLTWKILAFQCTHFKCKYLTSLYLISCL